MTHRGLSATRRESPGRQLLARHQTAALITFAIVGGLTIVLLFTSCEKEKPALKPGPPSTINLSGWKLSIPVPNKKGSPTLLEPAYTVAPWMVAHPAGGLEFWAPAKGLTTENSTHPRTELNSLTTFSAGRNARTLRASVTVLQVPQDGEGIILGQIHGAEDISSVPYVMLRYQNNSVKVVVKQVQNGDDRQEYDLLDDVPLKSRFEFTISDLGDGDMSFTAKKGAESKDASASVPTAFVGATVRFQAGDYQQADKPAGPTDGGRVVFHGLEELAGRAP